MAFYTHGGHQVGLGHLVRTRRTLEALRARCGPVDAHCFVPPDDDAQGLLRRWGVSCEVLPGEGPERYCEERLTELQPDLIVHDALDSRCEVMAVLRRRSPRLMTLDDSSEAAHLADLRVNALCGPLATGDDSANELAELGDVFLDPHYAELHARPFEVRPRVRRVLVSQGGADTCGVVPRIAASLSTLDANMEVVLLIGAAFRAERELRYVLESSPRSFRVARNVEDTGELFRRVDLAISGGGITLFELAAVGVPTLALTSEPREQATIARFAPSGFLIDLGSAPPVPAEDLHAAIAELVPDAARRSHMSAAGRGLVDGRGLERALDRLGVPKERSA